MRFGEFDIAREVLAGLQDLCFDYCTPIQEQCLPLALEGKDVSGRAQTGTGKTAAFLVAAFTRLLRNPVDNRQPGSCRVMVLAPTRELAIQIYRDAEAIGKYCGLTNLVIFGGMGHREQREALGKPIDILVGTPGRTLDYLGSRHLKLSETEVLVIDEADRMLDMGFIPDVRRIVSKLPPAGKRQTMLFSATLTADIIRLVNRWLVDPIFLEAESEQLVTDLIDQKFLTVTRAEKLALLLWLIKNDNVERMLVFSNRKDSSQRLCRRLRDYRVPCGLLTGDVSQERRLKILERFRAATTPVLVATDVAARGIHVDSVSHVVNYDLPFEPLDYVHRIGRTGRAGKYGKSISFVCEYGAFLLPELQELLGHEIRCEQPGDEALVLPPRPSPPRDGASGAGSGNGGEGPRPRRRRRRRRPPRQS